MSEIINYEPKEVLAFFDDICKIPRSSGKEQAISDYIVNFAKSHELKFIQDKALNVIVYKKATKGYENKPTLILQAHMDMVCVHDEDAPLIPEEAGVIPYVEDGFIKAKGTTLGADDGIGMAYILSILASNTLEHPDIEAVFTTSEEIGLDGAKALDISKLKGRKLINVDTEEEDNIVIGCAGGCRSEMSFKPKCEKAKGMLVNITIGGLAGGHSGVEIYKGRANANVLIGRLLYELLDSMSYSLVSIEGGTKDNAICVETKASIVVEKKALGKLSTCIAKFEKQFKSEYCVTDKDLFIKIENDGKVRTKVLAIKDMMRLLTLLNVSPAGVIKRRQSDPTNIETSLNMGIVRVDNKKVEVCHCLRSNIDAGRERLKYTLKLLADSVSAQYIVSGEYPAWESNANSDWAMRASAIYEKLYGKSLNIHTEHAGLECALFYSKMKDIDAISIGPDVLGAHTTKEAISIKSVEREWAFIKELLKD